MLEGIRSAQGEKPPVIVSHREPKLRVFAFLDFNCAALLAGLLGLAVVLGLAGNHGVASFLDRARLAADRSHAALWIITLASTRSQGFAAKQGPLAGHSMHYDCAPKD
jgi:hypothetical protein